MPDSSGLCGLACLALLLLPPVRWAWRKIRRRAPGPRPSRPARTAGILITLSALAGLIVLGVLVKNPILLPDGIPWPTPNMPTYLAVFLLSPYLMMAFTLAAALFEGLDWKRKTRGERWAELGKIALLVAYAVVVI